MSPTPDQSRAWATCAVAYDVAALMYAGENPNSAAVIGEQNISNGARLSSGMAFVFKAFKEGAPTPVEFQAKSELGQLAMKSSYETITTSTFTALERSSEAMMEGHCPTYKICWSWRKEEQTYVNLWRELYGSGL